MTTRNTSGMFFPNLSPRQRGRGWLLLQQPSSRGRTSRNSADVWRKKRHAPFKLEYQYTFPWSDAHEVAGARLGLLLADMGKKEWTIVIEPTTCKMTKEPVWTPCVSYNSDWHDQGHVQLAIEWDKLLCGLEVLSPWATVPSTILGFAQNLENGRISNLVLERVQACELSALRLAQVSTEHKISPLSATLARLDSMIVNPTFPSLVKSLGTEFHRPLMW